MEMPETEDGTQGLPKNLPLWSILHPHTGRRGSLGVLMAETGDGTQGLANKPAPARARAPEVCAGCAGIPPTCAPEARAPLIS